MRFKINRPVKEADYGKIRIISKFLWLPKKINYEIRWLEGAMIEQVVDRTLVLDRDCYGGYWYKYFWRDNKWVDAPANLK